MHKTNASCVIYSQGENPLNCFKEEEKSHFKGTYIDRRVNHSNDIRLVPKHQEHHCFLERSIKISYYNHKSSKRIPTALDGNISVSSNLVDSFEQVDYLANV